MFKFIGAVVVYGFAAYGLMTAMQRYQVSLSRARSATV
jgi:hypothetical protein